MFHDSKGQQHPLASLFNLQAKGPEGHVATELKEMLHSHLEKVRPILQECHAAGDPSVAIAAMESAKVIAFLRSLSRATAALESLLSVCRESSSVQVLEAKLVQTDPRNEDHEDLPC
eukprot:g19344.t1